MTNPKKTLDEKCWKGYKKKGMKTMFGKRYPNCVKVKKEGFSDWRSELEQIEEKTKLKNTNYGPAVVYQDNEKTVPARVRQQMPTGGDGTAYMGEAAVSQQQQKFMGMVYAYKKGEMPNASDEVKKAAESMTMKEVEKYASTKHAKLPKKIEEKLDKNDIPVIKGIIGKLEGASKKHKDQSIALKKAVEENTAIESELTIQDWNIDDIKFTEIETVDIIKAKPLKEEHYDWRLDEKFRFLKTLGKKIIMGTGSSLKGGINPRLGKAASYNAAILTTNNKLANLMRGKLKTPIDKIVSPNLYLNSADDSVKSVRRLAKTVDKKVPPNQTTNLTVDTSRDININKMFDKKVTTSKNKKFKKKGGDDDAAPSLMASYDWRADLGEDWQKVNRKDKTDGMSQKAVNAYKRENPGSKLKTAVTGKVKKGSKASKRRKSFCARSDGQRKMHNIDCKKTPNKRICKARRRWKC